MTQPKTTDETEIEIEIEPVQRTVGITISLWFFPEFDQWKLSLTRNGYGEPILAVGPFRARWKPVKIWR